METNLEILSDLSNEPLERHLANQEFSRLLVPPDFAESDRARTEPVGLLDTSGSLVRSS